MPPMLTDVGLRDAVVIVTGGGSGIGAATARQLGATGARVALVGRREALLKETHSQVPLGRIGAPEEVAVWITLLLSPLASFMTGAVIPLDGGQVIDRE
jgi:NAD(P)-dependent dehydrogenase (short-subunit alcohol dehydrogenase family)